MNHLNRKSVDDDWAFRQARKQADRQERNDLQSKIK